MRGNLRDRWRREVLRTSDVSDSVKVLLLVMADAMKEDGYVSVPRGVLCEALDKRDRVVAERLKLAVEARLIDRVQRGQKGRTSVYRALLPDPLSKRSHSTLSGGRVPVQGAVPARAERRPLGVQGVVSTDAERTEPQHPERPFSRPPVPRASSKHTTSRSGLAAVPASGTTQQCNEQAEQGADYSDSPAVIAARASWQSRPGA